MIELQLEWQEAPGVGDPVLARTWARLGLRINGREAIRILDMQTRSLRDGVYGSLFPLASWIVENWWSLLYEPPPSPLIFEGARVTHHDEGKKRRFIGWTRRHNLLFAREGMALPDLSICRDEDCIFVRWLPDPLDEERRRYFAGEGSERLKPEDMERFLYELVRSVLERLDGEHESREVAELKANWAAILDSQKNEPMLCQALAALGEDPYDPNGLDEELIAILEQHVLPLEPALRHDLLGGTSRASLEADYQCVESLTTRLRQLASNGSSTPWQIPADLPMGRTSWAHEDGYRRAQYLRKKLGLGRYDAIPDLATVVTKHLGDFVNIDADCPPKTQIHGLVTREQGSKHVLVTPTAKKAHSTSRRFLQARALHQWLFTMGQASSRRLLTGSSESEQRASRAFAAELLAPAAAIQQHLDNEEEVMAVAKHFDVSEFVILHQIDNHKLSAIG